MKDKFIVLTHEMIRDESMTMQEKIIYMEILNLSSLEKGCIASNSHFEKCFGISKKSVSNTISSLIKKDLITSELRDRNHTRILSIKDGQVSIKDGQVSIKDGETKENKTSNKKNNTYDIFLEFLKAKCKYKSKVTSTKEGKVLFNQIDNKKQLAIDYIKYQIEKKEYAVRITDYMKDYNSVYKQQETNNPNGAYGGWAE